uniref:Putative conserved secreted protein n=1 Tax=Amblyomma tuberculatum TaxID=48802 RepID=A0A6M2E0Y1_9ACAR
MQRIVIAILLITLVTCYAASAKYRYQRQFETFCKRSQRRKNTTLTCIEKRYQPTPEVKLNPAKVLNETCNYPGKSTLSLTTLIKPLPPFIKKT